MGYGYNGYNGYEGKQLEGAIISAKRAMDSIKKYKNFNLSLLQDNEINSLKQEVELACNKVKQIDFGRYRAARKYSGNTVASKLDHFLAIDDIMYNDELNLTIGIDWTKKYDDIEYKVSKHENLEEALLTVVDKTCVVYVEYADCLDDLDNARLAKAVYNMLKKINKAVSKGKRFVCIDAQTL